MLHPTSLPSGRLDEEAYRFVDWLAAAGQSWWQVLPLGPPDEAGSPYASSSAFAAWSGLLAEPASPVSDAEVDAYRDRHRFWARDWEAAGGALDDQVRFEREWSRLRAYARERGVRLIGDLPIYVAWDSVDHRSRPELFLDGVVAGAPPDDLGPEGQHWGNPLFDWQALARRRPPLVGRAAAPDVPARRRHPDRPLPRLRVLLGDPRLGDRRAHRALAPRSWRGTVPCRRARARPAPGARGGPRPDHAGRRRAARPARRSPAWRSCSGRCAARRNNPHRLENHREQQAVYTSTHDTETLAGAFPKTRPLAADRARDVLARRAVHAARCRTRSDSATRRG